MAELVPARTRPSLGAKALTRGGGRSFVTRAIAALSALGAMGAVLVASPARAQSVDEKSVEARKQYDLATAAFEARRYEEAASGYDAAVALRPNAVTLFIAAVAWDEAKRPERAADDYARALAVPGLDANRTKTAKTRLVELEQSLGTLLVTAPQGWRVRLDVTPTVSAPARLHGSIGRHTLSATSLDGSEQAVDVMLVRGQTRSIILRGPDVDGVATAPPSMEHDGVSPPVETREAPGSKDWTTTRILGVSSMIAGAVTMGSAVFLGTRVLDARDDYYASPTRGAYDYAKSMQTWTNVCWVAGSALFVAGAGLTFLPSLLKGKDKDEEPSVALTVSGRGVGVRGVF